MKIRLALLTLAVALAGCSSNGQAPRVQQRYATSNYLARTARRAVAPAPAPVYAAYGGGHAGHAGHGGHAGHAGHGGHRGPPVPCGPAASTNPCSACAPQSRVVYYDAGTVTVDHVHRYREINRHRIEITSEDIGCVDCP